MNSVTWLLVGAGDIARKRVAAALAETPCSSIAAVCEPDPTRLAELAGRFGIRERYRDLATALRETSATSVYLATPVAMHVTQAIDALLAGKHVLVEKPLGRTEAECLPLLDLARTSGLKAACAYFRRYWPRYEQTRQILASGELGSPTLIRMHYASWYDPQPQAWRVRRKESGGGTLSDMGSHMFDVLIGLLGVPASVFAKSGTRTHAYDAEDSAAVLGEMPDGTPLVASFQWNSRSWVHEFEVVGTEGRLRWSPFDQGPLLKTIGRDTVAIEAADPSNAHQPLIAAFVKAVIADEDLPVPLSESAKTSRVIDALYRSAQNGKEVRL